MALVVENGTAKADGESYATLVAFKAYCDGRGITYGADPLVEAALRKATDHMVEAYRLRWVGTRLTTTQALDWPRYNAPIPDSAAGAFYATNIVPGEVVRACIELAIRALDTTLTPDLTQAIKREKVGPIETEYQDFTQAGSTYPAVDRLLAPLLAAQGGVRISRA